MQKAILYCPSERVFIKDLLVYKPVLPGKNTSKPTSRLEVEILEINGENALVLLPNLLQSNGKETAIVNTRYLD